MSYSDTPHASSQFSNLLQNSEHRSHLLFRCRRQRTAYRPKVNTGHSFNGRTENQVQQTFTIWSIRPTPAFLLRRRASRQLSINKRTSLYALHYRTGSSVPPVFRYDRQFERRCVQLSPERSFPNSTRLFSPAKNP